MIIGLLVILVLGVATLVISQSYDHSTVDPENYVAGSDRR